jgi:hypothetical protein
MASPVLASASSSTAVDLGVDTPMKNPAAHLPMRSTFLSQPAAMASLSADNDLTTSIGRLQKPPLLACGPCSQTQDLMTLGIRCSRFLDILFVRLIIGIKQVLIALQ